MDVEGPELLSVTLEIITLLQSLRIVLEDELVKAQKRHRNCIAAKCTAVGFGTAGTIVSTVGVGIALAPVTAGISIPILTGIGFGVSTLSAVSSIGAEIWNWVSTKAEIGEVAELDERARQLQSTWDCLFSYYPFRDKLLSELNINRSPEAIRDDGNQKPVRETSVPKGESILKWLSIRKMYTDYHVNAEDLRPGDHIKVPGGHSASVKRYLRRAVYYHHGVYIGIIDGTHTVADFGRENRTIPVMTTLNDFCGSSNILFKRDYKGNDISVEETKNLARRCSDGKNWEEYNLLVNNCEHYATLLKLKQRWSEQAAKAKKIKYTFQTIFKKLPKPTLTTFDTAEFATEVVNFKLVVSNKLAGAKVTTNGAKVFKGGLAGLGVVFTIVDIAFLVRDITQGSPTPQAIKRVPECIKETCQWYESVVDKLI